MTSGLAWRASSVAALRAVILEAAESASPIKTIVLDPSVYALDAPLEIGPAGDRDHWEIIGPAGTVLRGVGDGFDLVSVLGRSVRLAGVTIDSTPARRDGAVGCGIKADNGTLGTTQSRLMLDRVVVTGQPEHGLLAVDPELHGYTDCDFMDNGGDGYRFVGDDVAVWNNTLSRVRSVGNGGYGFYTVRDHYSTWLGCQFFSNEGGAQARIDGGRGSTFVNGDFEHQGAATGDGLRLAGSGHQVLGGHFGALSRGIVLDYASWCRVDMPYFNNEQAATAMQGLVITSNSVDNRHVLRGAYPNATPLVDNGVRTSAA